MRLLPFSNLLLAFTPGQQVARQPEGKLYEDTDDMREMSNFVYRFAEVRSIVRDNRNNRKKTKTFTLFGEEKEEKEYKFSRPELILTQDGAKKEKENSYLKYPISMDAIGDFLKENRKLFKEAKPGFSNLILDEDMEEKQGPFLLEEKVMELREDNLTIYDFEDEFSTTKGGGLLYAVVVNLTKRRVSVIFRGTVGQTDAFADLNYALNPDSFFSEQSGGVFVDGNEPATHSGFTKYLFDDRECEDDRSYYNRILACVSKQFEKEEVKGKGFELYISGHSLGGGLANLFGFRVAHLKARGHESVKNLPSRVKVFSFASPCVGNEGYNKEFQYLEKKGFLRHVRVTAEGDFVPTNNIIFPFKFFFKGDTSIYVQNGVNMHLPTDENTNMEITYGNTMDMESQFDWFNLEASKAHMLVEIEKRMDYPVNKGVCEQTMEDLYKIAGVFDP